MEHQKPSVFAFNTFLRSLLEPKFGPLGEVQKHKLNYSAWRLGIATTGEPPFEADILAYPLGPFIAELGKQPNRDGDTSTLSAADRNLCLVVASRLGGISGKRLALRSHTKYPEWYAARKGLAPTQSGNRRITVETVRNATFLAPKNERVIEADDKKVIMKWNAQFHVWNFTVEGAR
jgi:uncharacterized phage-associated protein